MTDFANRCFVCGVEVNPLTVEKNIRFNLPVCPDCKDSDAENKAIEELLEGMADGFVCGCI